MGGIYFIQKYWRYTCNTLPHYTYISTTYARHEFKKVHNYLKLNSFSFSHSLPARLSQIIFTVVVIENSLNCFDSYTISSHYITQPILHVCTPLYYRHGGKKLYQILRLQITFIMYSFSFLFCLCSFSLRFYIQYIFLFIRRRVIGTLARQITTFGRDSRY